MANKKTKLLYVASTQSHLERFHTPYIKALLNDFELLTMATGDDVDLPVVFDKHFFSLKNLCSIFKIRKILRREKFDAIILHTTLAAFLVRSAMLGWRKRPYVMNVVHGYLFPKEARGMKDRILLLCEKLLRKKTDDIAVMNADDVKIAQENALCLGNVFFINGMGVTISPEIPIADPALRAQLATDGELLCTFIGELSARKNQIFLIRAVKRLRGEGIPIRLLLLGEGGEHDALQAEIKEAGLEDAVFLAGTVSPVKPYLAVSDLYVSASVSEGLPFNIMEAMSCGLPIVASDTKGQNDLLRDFPEALYPLDDMESFCDAVRRVYCSGNYGVGKIRYPGLDRYRLDAVFEDNMKIMTAGIQRKEA